MPCPLQPQMEKLVPDIPLMSMIVSYTKTKAGAGLVLLCLLTCLVVVVMGIEIPGTHFQYQDLHNWVNRTTENGTNRK